jgi:hypothetical protein
MKKFSISCLRKLYFNRQINGFDQAVKETGKKVIIDERRLMEWLKNT